MTGFEWSPTGSAPVQLPEPGSDGWCVRDAVCELFGWPPGSEEWYRFIEFPNGRDIERMCTHLGLEMFTVTDPVEWNKLIKKLDHPGLASFVFPSVGAAHIVYVHHIHALLHHWPTRGRMNPELLYAGWPLDSGHLKYGAELDTVIVDTRQPQGTQIRPPIPARPTRRV